MILYDRQMTATFSSQVEKKTKPCTLSTPPRTLQMHSEGQCWQYISLRLPCLVILGIVFAVHAKSRRPHELNALRRKLSKAPINYLQQHLNNYYFTRRLSVRPFGTFITDPQIMPLSCGNPVAPEISKTIRRRHCWFRWEAHPILRLLRSPNGCSVACRSLGWTWDIPRTEHSNMWHLHVPGVFSWKDPGT